MATVAGAPRAAGHRQKLGEARTDSPEAQRKMTPLTPGFQTSSLQTVRE